MISFDYMEKAKSILYAEHVKQVYCTLAMTVNWCREFAINLAV